MRASATTKPIRAYTLEDDGDGFELSLFAGGVQVGGGVFPVVSDEDEALLLALSIGEAFAPSGRVCKLDS